jgi:streptomycin 3"-adenylyltransferase
VDVAKIEPALEETAMAIAQEVADVCRSGLSGVYVHGSAVLGDFMWGVSDLDVLVVVDDALSEEAISSLAGVLSRDREMPATGVEASIVDRSVAAEPGPPWPFRVHVTTDPSDRRIVRGPGHAGDPDLALHYLVVRNAGWSACGAPAADVIGEVRPDDVIRGLSAELRWAAAEAPGSYAILNACRALRYVEEGVICSKTDGGVWAIEQSIEPDLVRRALASRREGSKQPASDDARAWIVTVADRLTA